MSAVNQFWFLVNLNRKIGIIVGLVEQPLPHNVLNAKSNMLAKRKLLPRQVALKRCYCNKYGGPWYRYCVVVMLANKFKIINANPDIAEAG